MASKQSLPQTRAPKYNEYLQGSGSRLRMFYFLFSVRLAGYDELSNCVIVKSISVSKREDLPTANLFLQTRAKILEGFAVVEDPSDRKSI